MTAMMLILAITMITIMIIVDYDSYNVTTSYNNNDNYNDNCDSYDVNTSYNDNYNDNFQL